MASLSFFPYLSFYSSNWQLVEAISRAIAFVGKRELDTKMLHDRCLFDERDAPQKSFLWLASSVSGSPSLPLSHTHTAFCHIPLVFAVVHHHHNGCIASATECCHQWQLQLPSCHLALSLAALARPSLLPPLLLLATLQPQPAFPSNFTAILLCVVDSANVLPANLFPHLLLSGLWQT